MKLAICGAWHVHAKDFVKIALEEKAEITGVYDEDAELRHALATEFGLYEYESLDELLASDADSVAVASSSDLHAEHMIKIANAKKISSPKRCLPLLPRSALR